MEHKQHLPMSLAEAEDSLASDPVCGTSVDPATARHEAPYGGKTFFFCSAGCREKFVAEPDRFQAASPPPASPLKPAPAGAIYTCPMHPEIRQRGPGHCPICGMALEPEVATGAEGPSAELADMTRRFWVALALSVPVFALEMGGHLTHLHMLSSEGALNWVLLTLATPVVLGRLAVL
jgi:P-type Cu+ transporter